MSKTDIMAELPKLTPDERREILDKIWELDGGDWLDCGELAPDERLLIEQRLADHEKNPEAAVRWAEVEARLLQRFKSSRTGLRLERRLSDPLKVLRTRGLAVIYSSLREVLEMQPC